MTKLNIIGDIHGRQVWEKLLVPDAINIFVGDYFSPYVDIPYEACAENYNHIIELKKDNPDKIVTLIGNHDLDHWYSYNRGCSRHDYYNEESIRKLFEDNNEHLQAAYCNGDVLVTHAGVSAPWMARYTYKKSSDEVIDDFSFAMDYRDMKGEGVNDAKTIEDAIKAWTSGTDRELYLKNGTMLLWKSSYWIYLNGVWTEMNFTPQSVCDFVNDMWVKNPEAFSFSMNKSRGDYYGHAVTHGPMWIRYEGLGDTNVFRGNPDYLQVYGHTQSSNIEYYSDETYHWKQWQIDNTGKMVMVDCLGTVAKSLIVELDDNGKVVKISENVVEQ